MNPKCECGHYLDEHEGGGQCLVVFDDPHRRPRCECKQFWEAGSIPRMTPEKCMDFTVPVFVTCGNGQACYARECWDAQACKHVDEPGAPFVGQPDHGESEKHHEYVSSMEFRLSSIPPPCGNCGKGAYDPIHNDPIHTDPLGKGFGKLNWEM